jgi:hypothetical protein
MSHHLWSGRCRRRPPPRLILPLPPVAAPVAGTDPCTCDFEHGECQPHHIPDEPNVQTLERCIALPPRTARGTRAPQDLPGALVGQPSRLPLRSADGSNTEGGPRPTLLRAHNPSRPVGWAYAHLQRGSRSPWLIGCPAFPDSNPGRSHPRHCWPETSFRRHRRGVQQCQGWHLRRTRHVSERSSREEPGTPQ